jgi:aspartyl-tRNA(Asn)/glutamyl-tRNA(Gln) amidotransferase subunit A
MARTVRDSALLFSVMAGPDERDPQSLPDTGEDFANATEGSIHGLRVAWSSDLGYALVDPEVRSLCAAAAKVFEKLGCAVEEADPGFEDPEPLFLDLTAPLRAATLRPYLGQWRDQMDPILVKRIGHADSMTAVEYEQATQRRTTLWHIVRRFFERFDVLLTPTIAVPPFPIGMDYPREIAARPVVSPLAWFPFTLPFAMTGQPAISVPCGWTQEGLPVGLQIVGRRFADATVLRVAHQFETACPWVHRRPSQRPNDPQLARAQEVSA